jgi:P27 family predicted phage terminase small subunit
MILAVPKLATGVAKTRPSSKTGRKMKGRKPKPTAMHKLHGTVNVTKHRARLDGEPIAVADIDAEPPSWLTSSQKESWRYAIANAPRGVIRAIDRGMLVIWCEAEDRHRKAIIAQAKIDGDTDRPMLARTKDGGIIQSPYLGIINRAAALMMKAAEQLGFSPVARPRLASAGQDVPTAPGMGDMDQAVDMNGEDLDAFLNQHPARAIN